jgi:HlyD family secretion protein
MRSAYALPLLALALSACRANSAIPQAGFLDAHVAQVATQVAGRIDSVDVQEGDAVKKDQLLVRLDAREREASVGQAQANLDQAREALKEAEANFRATIPTVKGAGADIAQAQATLDEAQINYDRADRLVRSGAAPASDLTSATARLYEAKAHLESLTATRAATAGRLGAAQAAVADARAAVSTADATLEVARVQLAEAEVRSPFDGLVVRRNVEPGEWAAPGTPVVTVEDMSLLWVRLDVGEVDLHGMRIGQPAAVHVMAEPGRTYAGHVVEIGAEGDFAVNRDVKRGRPDIRTFLVRVAIDHPGPSLRPGMTAEVFIAPSARVEATPQPRAER